VSAEFVDRAAGAPAARFEADLLVGSDGVHSAVRRALYPDEGPPKWNGTTMWRAVTEGEPFLSGRTHLAAGYPGRTLVVYPIAERGGGRVLLNWVANGRLGDGGTMPPQDWDHTGEAGEVAELYAGFRFDFLDLPALFRGAAAVYKYPMVDRDPLPSWDFRRVTLLGDAAHPMHPTGANGASQAIIDARVLARELALQPSVGAAVAAYDAQRRPETAAVVEANRRGGPMRPLGIVHERAPDGFERIEDVLSAQELADIAVGYKRTAGFDIDGLNNRPSLSVRSPRA
jgi:2-polyprenyl-6-methoxyphenol hydroxylase-like FAD-dependent oxidoreductase